MTTRPTTWLLSFLGISLVAGCPDREVDAPQAERDKVEAKVIPHQGVRKLDILFVIDNSESMVKEQASLIANFPRFINVLRSIEGGLPDIHIGVATSDMGTSGKSRGDDGVLCATTVLENGVKVRKDCAGRGITLDGNVNYLSDGPNTATTDPNDRIGNYSAYGTLDAAFSKIATVGTYGTGFEQHLAAANRALDKANAPNAGFLRDDAYLAVIVIADEDDCSMLPGRELLKQDQTGIEPSFLCTRHGIVCDPDDMTKVGALTACKPAAASPYIHKVDDMIAQLRGVKADPDKQLIVSAISGPNPDGAISLVTKVIAGAPKLALGSACAKSQARSAPSIRLGAFLNGFANHSQTSICQEDLSEGLYQIGLKVKAVLGTTCFDTKLAAPLDCQVSEVRDLGKPTESSKLISQCDAANSNAPCWRIATDTAKCPAPATGQHIVFERGNTTIDPDATTKVDCVTE